MRRELVRKSRFLSLVLRHHPQRIGLTLDAKGNADVGELLRLARAGGVDITQDELVEIVATNDKRRFELSDDGVLIRARQGHSIDVDLDLVAVEPPAVLYHGTARKNLASIRGRGLVRGSRRHVHLSAEKELARTVGARHGSPVVLSLDAARMHAVGHAFFVTGNRVWLTERVPPEFLSGLG